MPAPRRWHDDVINHTLDAGSLHGVNFNDGFHTASSITSDSDHYGIRRFRVGTLADLRRGSAGALRRDAVALVGERQRRWWLGRRRRRRCARMRLDGGESGAVADNHVWSHGRRPGGVAWRAAANPTTSPRIGTLTSPGALSTSRRLARRQRPQPEMPAVSVGDVIVAEGSAANTTASFAVTLSAPSAQTVTVGYATVDGTALAGSDYVSTAGTVTFPPGVTAAVIPVTVLADAATEPAESFQLHLVCAEPCHAARRHRHCDDRRRRDRRRAAPCGSCGGVDRRRCGHAALERAGGRTGADRRSCSPAASSPGRRWPASPSTGRTGSDRSRCRLASITSASTARSGRRSAWPRTNCACRWGSRRRHRRRSGCWAWPWDPRSPSTGARPSAPGHRRAPCSKSAGRRTWRCRSAAVQTFTFAGAPPAPTRSPCARPTLTARAARRTRCR